MATPNFSALLPDAVTDQLNALVKLYGINKTQVVIRAIQELYKGEAKNMTTETEPVYKPTKKNIAAVQRWWKAGKNIWEISQLTGLSESEVTYIAREYT